MPSVVVTGSTTARHALSDGVLSVTFTGLCTRNGLAAARKRIAVEIKGDVRCVVADYTAAALALGHADVWELMTDDHQENLPTVPAAVVTQGEVHDLFRRNAIGAAAFNLPRRAFCDRRAALEWARQQARVSHETGPLA